MNISDEIKRLISISNKETTSHILTNTIPIALRMSDYIGFCVMNLLNLPFNNKETNAVIMSGHLNTLKNIGLTYEQISGIREKSLQIYFSIRQVGDDSYNVLSANQLEKDIDKLHQMLESCVVPKGLQQLDLYYENQRVLSERKQITELLIDKENELAKINAYITNKLQEYDSIQMMKRPNMDKNTMANKNVFIIHGHCGEHKLKLRDLLRDRWALNPIILDEEADRGNTIIEKFERIAATCSYAIALFTPDDIVEKKGKQYMQVRPNVIFELGWFYSQLGRERVCILNKKSPMNEVWSDLQGILRLDFYDNVDECALKIEKELKASGII